MVLCLTVDQVPTEDPVEPEVGDASKVSQALGNDLFFLKRRHTGVERKSDPAMRTKDCTLFKPRYQTLNLAHMPG
jgi:hypothetical protein